MALAALRPSSQHVGIVVVHGVIPHPRYAIQDQTAAELVLRLNQRDNSAGSPNAWVVDVLNPPPAHPLASPPSPPPSPPASVVPKTTLSRVHRATAPGAPSDGDVFDVVEAYWSPLDKNKTTYRSVLAWLLRTVFTPLNTTARYMASWSKSGFDIGYVGLAALLAVGSLVAALWLALHALQALVVITARPGTTPSFATLWEILGQPTQLAKALTVRAGIILAVGAVGAFLLAQALKGIISVLRQRAKLAEIPVQLWSRIAVIVLLLVLAAAGLLTAYYRPLESGRAMGGAAWLFVFSALFFEFARALLQSFLVNFFGDVQIYTTHDENSDFYGLRESILEVVTRTIADMTSKTAADGARPYERVHVLAHSLGSTIALDALIRLYNLKQQAAYDPADFDRIRSFVTFGSALEKTKYFFDATNASPSLALDQWRDDAYGVLFSKDRAALDFPNGSREGIYWTNFWYSLDPIANEIDSYRSFLVPGEQLADASRVRKAVADASAAVPGQTAIPRPICENHNHRGVINPFVLRFIPHGDYLGDGWFWYGNPEFGTLDVVTSRTAEQPPVKAFALVRAQRAEVHRLRYEFVPDSSARGYRDKY